jgi:hypothetical protein
MRIAVSVQIWGRERLPKSERLWIANNFAQGRIADTITVGLIQEKRATLLSAWPTRTVTVPQTVGEGKAEGRGGGKGRKGQQKG